MKLNKNVTGIKTIKCNDGMFLLSYQKKIKF